METNQDAFQDIKETLAQLRLNPNTRRHFPHEFWDAVIKLTQNYSIEEVCRQLDMSPIYLKRKMETKRQILEFREISIPKSLTQIDTVTIELSAPDGLRAKIQGSISCLSPLFKLFER